MKKILLTIAIILAIGLLVLMIFPYKGFSLLADKNLGDLKCVNRQEEKTVRGQSLEGVLNEDETVKVFYGYYNCNEVKRDDFIIYNYTKQSNELIKMVKAIPGDKIELRTNEQGERNIFVNDEILKNSIGDAYVLPIGKKTMIELHINDYNEVMPADNYIILGNLANGSIDSIKFGFVKKDDIIGKVQIISLNKH